MADSRPYEVVLKGYQQSYQAVDSDLMNYFSLEWIRVFPGLLPKLNLDIARIEFASLPHRTDQELLCLAPMGKQYLIMLILDQTISMAFL